MAETYKKTLLVDEYLAVFKLGSFFNGSETARFVAAKINERIGEVIREKSTQELAFDEKNNPVLDESGNQKIKVTPPESMEITFTRNELDGFFVGVKETLLQPDVRAKDIAMIGDTCRSLGMQARFEKVISSVIDKIELDKDPLDCEL